MSENQLDRILDQTLDDIQNERPDAAAEKAATERVWARLSQELEGEAAEEHNILSHEAFQALIPSYLKGELARGKVMLLEDHVGECVPCRRALKSARTVTPIRKAVKPRRRSAAATWGWRAAAAAALIVALIGVDVQTELFTIQAQGLITIERVEGQVMRVTDEGVVPVANGEQLSFDQVRALRTGKDSGATFRMSDDSVVEMNERAELSVATKKKFWQRGNGDGVIALDRGSIIVEASEQGSGHLYVETNDTDVAVTGTVFAVNAGVKGSRVSVIEGSVDVAFNGRDQENERQLTPGDQVTSSDLLGHVEIEDEIAWSQKKLEHLSLLAEMTRTLQDIERQLDWPALRYDTTLLDLAPQNTAVYIAIPNISRQIADGYGMLQSKVAENELLSDWWNEQFSGTEADSQLSEMIGRIEAYGAELGTEIVVAMPYVNDDITDPIVFAQLRDEKAFASMLREDLANEGVNVGQEIAIIDDSYQASALAADAKSFVMVRDGYLAIAPDSASIYAFGQRAATKSSEFSSTELHTTLSALYSDGAEWIIAADLARIMPDNNEELATLGLDGLQHVIGERKQKGDRSESRFVVTFDEPRKGLASWLAEPAPMGSLDFISGNAQFAASFAMREPSVVLNELFTMAGSSSGSFDEGLAEFEAETGLNLQADLLDALGGEFTMAFDGPIVPIPSWKLVFEVYDSGRLQQSIGQLVELINEKAVAEGIKGLRLSETGSANKRFYQLESLDVGLSAHYTYVDGYLLAGASRPLLQRAINNRKNGMTLVNSPRFQQAMPADAEVNFSAVVFQDLSSVLGPFARTIGAMGQRFSQDQQNILENFGANSGPTVTVAYGEPERIIFVNSSQGGLLSSTLGSFLRFETLTGMQELLTHAASERGADSN